MTVIFNVMLSSNPKSKNKSSPPSLTLTNRCILLSLNMLNYLKQICLSKWMSYQYYIRKCFFMKEHTLIDFLSI